MSEDVTNYPLAWPVGWPRWSDRTRATFGTRRKHESYSWMVREKMSIAGALDRLLHELKLLDARAVVVSTNVRTRLDGLPYSKAAEPEDPGAAVYFQLQGEPRVLACDRWDRVADNIAAIAKHVEAIRGQLRWGVGNIRQAFGGYLRLTAAPAIEPWWMILGIDSKSSRLEIELRRRKLLLEHHPDRGGSASRAAEINAAADEGLRSLA